MRSVEVRVWFTRKSEAIRELTDTCNMIWTISKLCCCFKVRSAWIFSRVVSSDSACVLVWAGACCTWAIGPVYLIRTMLAANRQWSRERIIIRTIYGWMLLVMVGWEWWSMVLERVDVVPRSREHWLCPLKQNNANISVLFYHYQQHALSLWILLTFYQVSRQTML